MHAIALSLAALALTLGANAQAQTSSLCCNDASGRRTCGDTLPQACYDRAYVEIRGGRTVRSVDAPMTSEQRAHKDAELKAQRDKLAREAEARRRDQVLLDTYATVSELDRRRDSELGNLEGEIRATRAREADLLDENARLNKQKPAKGNVPKVLAENIATSLAELDSVRLVIASKRREIEQMRTRFEADRKRYIELTAGSAPR